MDDTNAFHRALAAGSGFAATVYVPAGGYRIDGTISLDGDELILAKGARLFRLPNQHHNNTAPLVQLHGTASRLTGSGTISTSLPSPRGVVCIGPTNTTIIDNVEYSVVDGITIDGPGLSYKADGSDLDLTVRGSVGLGMDNSVVLAKGGSTYQNTASNLLVQNVDVGVQLGPVVNANYLTNIVMVSARTFCLCFPAAAVFTSSECFWMRL